MSDIDRYKSLRRIILASMIVTPFIPFVLAMGVGYYYFTKTLENSSIATMQRIVQDHRKMIETFLGERAADLTFIADTYPMETLSDPEKLKEVFTHLQQKSNAFTDLGVFNADGVHIAYCGPYPLAGKIYTMTDWFIEVIKSGLYISDVFLGYRNVPHFVIAIARGEGERKWVIRATIDTYAFVEKVKQVRIGRTGEAYIENRGGILQTERRSGGAILDADPDYRQYPEASDEIRTFLMTDEAGHQYLSAITMLNNEKWLLLVRQEKADAFQNLRRAIHVTSIIAVIAGAIIIVLAFYLTDRIVGRMKYLDSERGQLEQKLISASRLAELGQMSAGFAHEINNPLQIMKSEKALIDTLIEDLEAGKSFGEGDAANLAELKESLTQIQLQINRCAQITQSILKFGRQSAPVQQDLDLNAFIPEITRMIAKKAQVGGIAVNQAIDKSLPPVYGDPAQLQQVLLNLYNNAMDAIAEKHGLSGGALTIAASAGSGGAVEIRISDNGAGISPENQKKIFTPFFTTKPVGKGTGLGLSVCYGIIRGMGGNMTLESREGEGTTFIVTLPSKR